jgi:hypothetical protein
MDSKNSDEHVDPAAGVQSDSPERSSIQPIGAGEPRSAADSQLPSDVGRRLRISLLLVGSLVLGVVLALTPRYETNDDAGMNLVAAGRGFVDRPDEHLLYSNVVIGLALKTLYQAAPSVPWYGGLWFLTACVSLTAICFACLHNASSEWTVGLLGAFLWFAGIPDLTQLQFTRIAFLAGLAGLLLLVSGIKTSGATWQHWFAIPLLLVGELIRFDAVRLMCVVLLPAILWMLWRCRSEKNARRAVAVLASCLLVGWGAVRFNDWYYARDPDWKDFHPFNILRVEFMDFDHVQYDSQTAGAFTAAGWKSVDLQMLRNWVFLDEDRYNSQNLRTILESLPQNGSSSRPWQALVKQLAADRELWGLLACGAAIVMILAVDRSARLIPLACFVVSLATCAVVYRFMHLPARVYCPVIGGCVATALVFANGPRAFGKCRGWAETRFGHCLALGVVGAAIVWRGYGVWRSNANYVSYHKSAVQMLADLGPKAEQIYVIWAGDFPFEYVTLPLGGQSLPASFKVMTMGNTSGFTRKRLRELGVRDLRSLVRRGGQIYFVCQPADIELLDSYFSTHFDEHLTSHAVFAHPALYGSAVYQVAIAPQKPHS